MGRHKGYNRNEVLEKAMTLFWRKGFEGSHLGEIVETTGLNRFSLYKEFGGKDGLYREAMQLYLQKLRSISAPLSQEPKGWNNIKQYFENVLDYDFVHGCFFVNALIEKQVAPKSVVKDVTEFAVQAEDGIYQNIKAAQENGEIKSKKDPKLLTKFFFSFDIGFITYFIIEKDSTTRRDILQLFYDLFEMPGQSD